MTCGAIFCTVALAILILLIVLYSCGHFFTKWYAEPIFEMTTFCPCGVFVASFVAAPLLWISWNFKVLSTWVVIRLHYNSRFYAALRAEAPVLYINFFLDSTLLTNYTYQWQLANSTIPGELYYSMSWVTRQGVCSAQFWWLTVLSHQDTYSTMYPTSA